MDDGEGLFRRARGGDEQARAALLEANLGLVHHVVRRFVAGGHDAEELFQVGCLGLLKAIDRFEPERGFAFATYACPLILGEIRRHLRAAGAVAMPRDTRALARRARRLAEAEQRRTGREPTLPVLAAALAVPAPELAAALAADAAPLSLDAPGEDDAPPLGERLPSPGGEAWERVLLAELLRQLPPRERRVIALRYLLDRTQAEVGAALGVSQVQVSRLERRALERLRAAART
jgi:RNA polymerase sporulation-specific sigma factor